MKNIIIGISFIFVLLMSFGCNKEIIEGTPDPFVTTFVDDINADTLKQYVQNLQNNTTRFFLNENRKKIANDIKSKFIQLGYTNTRIDSFYLTADWDDKTYNIWQYNVIARLEGSVTPTNIYVVGAHYDCIVDEGDPFVTAPGANDNASGVAGILEIARILKHQNFVPKNTIEFVAFASEEYNLNGSADYVAKAKQNNNNIIMMLNNDMISYDPSPDPTKWKVNVMDYKNSEDLRTKFVQCGETYTTLNFTHKNKYNDYGDSYSFYNGGFEAVFVISDADEAYYHTVNDIYNNYNYNYCKAVTSVSCALLVQENKN